MTFSVAPHINGQYSDKKQCACLYTDKTSGVAMSFAFGMSFLCSSTIKPVVENITETLTFITWPNILKVLLIHVNWEFPLQCAISL